MYSTRPGFEEISGFWQELPRNQPGQQGIFSVRSQVLRSMIIWVANECTGKTAGKAGFLDGSRAPSTPVTGGFVTNRSESAAAMICWLSFCYLLAVIQPRRRLNPFRAATR